MLIRCTVTFLFFFLKKKIASNDGMLEKRCTWFEERRFCWDLKCWIELIGIGSKRVANSLSHFHFHFRLSSSSTWSKARFLALDGSRIYIGKIPISRRHHATFPLAPLSSELQSPVFYLIQQKLNCIFLFPAESISLPLLPLVAPAPAFGPVVLALALGSLSLTLSISTFSRWSALSIVLSVAPSMVLCFLGLSISP